MSFDYKIISPVIALSSGSNVIYTNPTGSVTYIRNIILHNVSSSLDNIGVYISAPGTTNPLTSERILSVALSGSATYLVEFGIPGIMLSSSQNVLIASSLYTGATNFMSNGGRE